MTPRQLVELTEAKELMQLGQYKQALEKLYWLTDRFPDDQEIKNLISTCRANEVNNWMGTREEINAPNGKKKPQEVTIVFKSASNMALVLFLVITLAIVAAWYLIFYVFNFTLKIRPAEIQYFVGLTRLL